MPARPNIVILISPDTGRFVSPYGIDTADTPTLHEVPGDYYLLGAHIELGSRGAARRPQEELYDLDADPTELNNIAENVSYGDVRNDLRNRLAGWMRETGDALLDGPIASPTYYQARDMLFG